MIWGMVGFSIVSFLMTFGGLYAAIESRNLSEEEPWKEINIESIQYAKRE
jgi:hypothetical protein